MKLSSGCFRLADGLGREMFSKHSCNDYGILPGATIYVQVRVDVMDTGQCDFNILSNSVIVRDW